MLGQQGLITEAGYNEQAASYKNMSEAATAAGNAENQASTFAEITAGIKGIAAIADVFTGLPVSSVVSGFIPQAPSDSSNPLRINQYAAAEPASSNPLGGLY